MGIWLFASKFCFLIMHLSLLMNCRLLVHLSQLILLMLLVFYFYFIGSE
jgi:hypothetical protein